MYTYIYIYMNISAGPYRGHQSVGVHEDLCALLIDPVILFLRSDQSLSYCCTVIKDCRSKV